VGYNRTVLGVSGFQNFGCFGQSFYDNIYVRPRDLYGSKTTWGRHLILSLRARNRFESSDPQNGSGLFRNHTRAEWARGDDAPNPTGSVSQAKGLRALFIPTVFGVLHSLEPATWHRRNLSQISYRWKIAGDYL